MSQPHQQPQEQADVLQTLQFSEKVDKALREILPPVDLFDAPNFEPVTLINDMFPNEQALDQLDSFVMKFKRKIRVVDSEILNFVRRQSTVSAQATRDLDEAQRAITGLFGKVADIKRKAEGSENMVTQFTKDIRQLDNSKKNLGMSVKIMQNLHFVVSNISKVREAIKKRKYEQVASLLEKINDKMQYFDKYADAGITKLKNLQRSIKDLKEDVKSQIFTEFKGLDTIEARTGQKLETLEPTLIEACTVVDALTDDIRNELITMFSKQQLSLFNMIKENNLENLKKRYSNMRKILKKYKETYIRIFPDHWRVPHDMIMDFCLMTREEIVRILTSNKNVDAKVLYSAIFNTIRFESDMQTEYAQVSDEQFNNQFDAEQAVITQELEKMKQEKPVDADDASARITAKFQLYIRRKQLEDEKYQRQQAKLEDVLNSSKPVAQEKKQTRKPTKSYNFAGVISSCFEDFMDRYIQFERSNMDTKLKEIMQRESWDPHADTASYQDIFLYIQNSMNQCIVLSKGRTLYRLLTEVWKHFLLKYAEALNLKLPRVVPATKEGVITIITNLVQNNPPENAKTLLEAKERATTCFIINAASYCQQNIEEMESVLKETIEENYRNNIKLEQDQENFYKLLKNGIEVLVTSTINLLEPEFGKMAKIPWANFENVGDQSEYATSMIRIMGEVIAGMAYDIPKNHYKFFCDSFVLAFCNSFTACVYKCKKISQSGAQQLLLDLTAIGGLLKKLLTLGKPLARDSADSLVADSSSGSAHEIHQRFDEDEIQSFVAQVQSRLLRGEVVLKVLQANQDVLAETYFSMLPEGNASELGKILDVRGLQRNDRQVVLTKYETLLNPKYQQQAQQSGLMSNIAGFVFRR